MEHTCPRRLSLLRGLVARATKRAREIGWKAMHTKTDPLYDVVNMFYKYTPNASISFESRFKTESLARREIFLENQ